jgi:hypoxanthine phosphoribosyltransferase
MAVCPVYAGSEIIVVGLLKGAFIFVADLLRDLTVNYKIDFMVVSSYAGTTSGNIRLKQDLEVDPHGKHILVVEDLIDTGKTLKWMKEHLQTKAPASVRIACLLDKAERREVDVEVDFVGWTCPDEFVVGYGMDFDNGYRCMPFVGVLKPEAYARL